MRCAVLVLLIAIPAIALAKPKVAVAPIEGDRDGEVTEAVEKAAGEHAKVTGASKVEEALGGDAPEGKAIKRVRSRLQVDAVLHGKVEKKGGKKKLELTVAGRGKKRSKITVEYKTNKELRKELEDKLAKPIEASEVDKDDDKDDDKGDKDDDKGDDKSDDDDRRADRDKDDKKDRDRDDKKDRDRDDKKGRDRDDKKGRDRDRDDDRRADRDDDDDDDRRADRDDDDDDGSKRKRRKKRRKDHVLTQAGLWADGGLGFERRTLTYDKVGSMAPPPVGTAAPAGRIEAEAYPGQLLKMKGPAANIGLALDYTRVFFLSINVPAMMVSAPISSGGYSLGARYRIKFRSSSVALGMSYWRRNFEADRSGLMMPTQLDMPDVDYTAIAFGALLKVGITPKLGAIAGFAVPLMLDTGPIQEGTSYGSSTIVAVDIRAGAQYQIGPHYAVQAAFDLHQVGFRFDASPGTMAQTRGISTAMDRVWGLSVTVGIMY